MNVIKYLILSIFCNHLFAMDYAGFIKVDSGDSKTYGQGIVVLIEKKTYFMTNAHVCLGSKKQALLAGDEIDNKSNYFEIQTKVAYLKKEIKFKEMIYNFNFDLCLIPIVANSGYELKQPEFDRGKAYFVSYQGRDKRLMENSSRYYGKILQRDKINKSYFVNSQRQKVICEFKFNKVTWFDFNAISGDSGSPVFNQNNELIGILFASRNEESGAVIRIEDIITYVKSIRLIIN